MTPTSVAEDKWSRWLLETRFGGDAETAERGMRELRSVRDRVLDGANVGPGATLLDVGCGDGLISFGALDRVGSAGHVIFSDISAALLDHCRRLAGDAAALTRCSFVEASADDLRPIDTTSVDAVTTRSVLIYVKDKAAAFREFYRVLRPGGRMSLFEPINSFRERDGPAEPAAGSGVDEVADLVQRLQAFYRELQPDDDPMLDFDERDLLRTCEAAGFDDVRLQFEVVVRRSPRGSWPGLLRSSGNPNIPTLGEAMRQIFTDEERTRYERVMRPRIEAGGQIYRGAVAYLRGTKDAGRAEQKAER